MSKKLDDSKKRKPTKKPRKPSAKAQENRRQFADFVQKNPSLNSNQAKAAYRKETGRSIGNQIAREVYRDVKDIEINPAKITRKKPKPVSEHGKKYLDRWSYLFKYRVIDEGGVKAWDTGMYTTMEEITVREAYKRMRARLLGEEAGFEYYRSTTIDLKSLKLVEFYFNPDAI